jgi:acyl carrier protein
MDEIEKTVRKYIVDNFLFGREDSAPAPEASFLELRLIDSTGVLELVQFLESEYGITVEDTELVPDNLDSLRRIAAFVTRKTGRG